LNPAGPELLQVLRPHGQGWEAAMTSLADNAKLSADEERFLRGLGQQLRADSIRCSTAAGSGHPTSAMSAADLMAVLLARHLRYDWDNPAEPGNDHLISPRAMPRRCCMRCSRRLR
jgi:hypothetical protein